MNTISTDMADRMDELYGLYLGNRKVTTDSRAVEPGAIYFALKGERFDGNDFAAQALENGASLAVVDKQELKGRGDAYFYVEDVLRCLQILAGMHARAFQGVRIGLTGSNGKTTTKELLRSVLSKKYRVHATSGNFNNHIGLPLSVLACPEEAEIMVLEMGANKRGDTAELAEIGAPTHGIVTCIGSAHLEGMGGIEGVKKTKAELYDYLAAHSGVAFVAEDMDYLRELSSSVERRVFYGGQERQEKKILWGVVRPESLYAEGRIWFDDGGVVEVRSQLFGSVHFHNIQTALAVGKYFGVAVEDMVDAIAAYQPGDRRIEWIERGGHKVLLDAYNANPDSTAAVVSAFARLEDRRKIVVLGDMLELGPYAEEGHRRVLEEVRRTEWAAVLLLGENYAAASPGDLPEGWQVFREVEELFSAIGELTVEPSTVLVKASRGLKLERVLEFLSEVE